MTVTAPPELPQPPYDELEALIEEARRRARRRRLLIAAAAVFGAVLLAGTAAGIVVWTRSGSSGEKLRPGFRAVQARGPVHHALLEDLRSSSTTVALAGGATRPTHTTREIWWDPRSGLYRTLYRQDGIAVSDLVQQNCFGTGSAHMCIAPSPFDLRIHGLGWPTKAGSARRVGTGTFRGRRVVWVEGFVRPPGGKPYPSGDQVAYDAITHTPLALRTIFRGGPARFRGKVFNSTAVTLLPDVRANDVTFAVPDGGAPRNEGLKESDFRKASLARAAAVLGRAPLWLGRTYRGHRLRFVQTGRMGSESGKNGGAAMAPVVRLDYGPFRIDEFGDERPLWLEHPPPPGKLFVNRGLSFTYGRDGVVVDVEGGGHADPAGVRALATALRPVPAG